MALSANLSGSSIAKRLSTMPHDMHLRKCDTFKGLTLQHAAVTAEHTA